MVAFAPARLSWPRHVSGLRQLGRVSGQVLHLRPLHLAVLFAGALRRLAARPVRSQAVLVSAFLPFSPALLILWIPGLFRFTCYYYRGAYYKSFWADPPACAVSEPRKSYLGERSFPLILQNFHRYFLRLSYLVWGFLVYDVWKSFWFRMASASAWARIVLTVNVVLLGGYIFGCHAFRHLVGGSLDQISEHPVRHKLYDCVSCLNGRPQEMGLGEPVLGRLRRYLRPPVLHGHLDRLENLLDGGIPDVSPTTSW